jgi:CBS domain containing-hemolysin-like protein
MTAEIAFRLLGGIFLVLANAFFVSIEFALTRLRQYSEDEIKADKGLERAWEMTKELEIYLTGCQLGISVTSILLGIVAEPAVTRILRPLVGIFGVEGQALSAISVVVGIIIINLIHKIWGEQSPTYLGVERPRQVAHYLAPGLYWWVKITYPFILLGDGLAKQTLRLFNVEMTRSWVEEESSPADIKGKIGELLKSGGMSEDRRDEVVKALEIDEIPVRDIMVPREKVISLSTNKNISENLKVVRSHMQSRYPLVGDSLEDFKGLLYTSEILAHIEELQSGDTTLLELSRSDMTVLQDLPVSELIDRFQQEHQELALVKNDDTITGLVTLTDALEVIVGSAEDPTDLELRS